MLSQKKLLAIAALVAVDFAFFLTTNPERVPSFVLAVGFILMSVNLYVLFIVLCRVIGLYIGFVAKNHRRLARLLTIFAVILLGLKSMGQLTAGDVAGLVPLALVLYFYISYYSAKIPH